MGPALRPPEFGEGDGCGVHLDQNLTRSGLRAGHGRHPQLLRTAPFVATSARIVAMVTDRSNRSAAGDCVELTAFGPTDD